MDKIKMTGYQVRANTIQHALKIVFLFLALMSLDMGSRCLAQRLIIESPSPGPAIRVFYGQLTLSEFFLYEKKYALEGPDELTNSDSKNYRQSRADQNQEATPAQTQKSTVLASLNIGSDEAQQCTSSNRFKGFMTLVAAMKGKVNNAKIHSAYDTLPCAEKIHASLEKALGTINVVIDNNADDGIKIELGLVSEAIVKTHPPPPAPRAEEPPLTLEQILRFAQLKIGENSVKFLPTGWFVFETQDTSEVQVELQVPGRKKLVLSAYPITLTQEPKAVNNGIGYRSHMALFSKASLNIYTSQVPFLAQSTTIDGGAGGGMGYGREVPGERRGDRLVSLLGIEKRQIWDSFGIRGTLLYSNSSKTVVPNTYTLRGIGFYDQNFSDDSLVLRISAGTELFRSQITEPKAKATNPNIKPESARIPSLVVAPLVGLSIHKIFKNGIILAPAIFSTPIYVSPIGFYPSTSSSVEIGYKIMKNLVIILNVGTERHRFPSQIGETKLQMDYTVLTLKRGLI